MLLKVREKRAQREAEKQRQQREREAEREAREEARRKQQKQDTRRKREAQKQEELLQQEMVKLRRQLEERKRREQLLRQRYSQGSHSQKLISSVRGGRKKSIHISVFFCFTIFKSLFCSNSNASFYSVEVKKKIPLFSSRERNVFIQLCFANIQFIIRIIELCYWCSKSRLKSEEISKIVESQFIKCSFALIHHHFCS